MSERIVIKPEPIKISTEPLRIKDYSDEDIEILRVAIIGRERGLTAKHRVQRDHLQA